jgi:hypothetical protein
MDNGQTVTMPIFISFVEAVFDLIDRYGGYRKFRRRCNQILPSEVLEIIEKFCRMMDSWTGGYRQFRRDFAGVKHVQTLIE